MLISAGDFLERLFGVFIADIHVGMVFFRKLAVVCLDFGFITWVFEVKHSERVLVPRADGFYIGADGMAVAEHAAEGFLELRPGVLFELIHPPSRAVTGRRVALEGVDFVRAHALEIVPAFVESSDVFLAKPLIIAQIIPRAWRTEIPRLRAIRPVAAMAGRFDRFRFFALCHGVSIRGLAAGV